MNSDQIDIIKQYLKIDTDYAIIINGGYGTGKTHFFKEILVPEISEISTPKSEKIKFLPLHISLFGYKSVDEIQSAIFFELFPILKRRNVKLAANIGKTILRGLLRIGQAGDIDEYFGDITTAGIDSLEYDQLVICFDDLDRKCIIR